MNKKSPVFIAAIRLGFFYLRVARRMWLINRYFRRYKNIPLIKPEQKNLFCKKYANMTPAEIVLRLSLKEKAAQMVQGVGYFMTANEMKKNCYGSVLQCWNRQAAERWKFFVLFMQKKAIESPCGIPYIFGDELNHGAQKCEDAVIYPHNIGIGAANDPELTYKMGLASADESKMTGMIWHFSPCVASAQDPRWGRAFESYSSDTGLVKKLSAAFVKGSMDGGVYPCPKHFLGDGDVDFGTGENSVTNGLYVERLIDRGDSRIGSARIEELLSVYKTLVDCGVNTIMVSYSSINGVKMHTKKDLITDKLKGELGFKGFVLSDWDAIYNIPGDSQKEKIATAVNAGIDMLMDSVRFKRCAELIVKGVEEGLIDQSRIDDAVTRIIKAKKEMGLFDDPMMENVKTTESKVGSDNYRNIARQLAEKSLVLLKNEKEILPLKHGSKIFITGPASNDTGVLCGGLTLGFTGSLDSSKKRFVPNGKTILDGFKMLAGEYGYTIITDPKEAETADAAILCIGEEPYAEWFGDTGDLSITGKLALGGNAAAITAAKKLGKPTVTLIIAGRNVIYDEYEEDWDAVVMCYLPGSEGNGIANVIAGKTPFTGKLPMPYYSSVNDIKTDKVKFDIGYGLN